MELSSGLELTGWAPQVVTWRDIRAWTELMFVELYPWEARTLVNLGTLRASIHASKSKKPAAGSGGKGRGKG